MDQNDIERLRVQGFTVARRGYDQREVDKFLDALTEWLDTDAAKDLGGTAVMRKLELAGKSTAQILLTTEKESEQMRLQTEEECAKLRSKGEAASLETRRAAEEYAKKVRDRADEYARSTGEAAGAKAKRTIEEGESRRAQVETVIGDLDVRRANTLKDLERLHGELGSTIEKYGSGARPSRRNGGKEKQKAKSAPAQEPDAVTNA
jgi:DivIVA domain-containing protein